MDMNIVTLAASWVIARLKEPSTWAGVGVFLNAHLYNFAWLASPDVVQYSMLLVASVLAVVIKEITAPKVADVVKPAAMKSLAFLLAVVLTAGALSGCSAYNNAVAALGSQNSTQAATNVKTFTTALTCSVASTSALASQIAAQTKAGTAAIRDATNICVASSDVCNALGGTAVVSACSAQIASGS